MSNALRPRTVALLIVIAILGLAACGDDAEDSTAGTAGGDPETPTTDDGPDTAELEPLSLRVALPWEGAPPLCCLQAETAELFGYFEDLNLEVEFQNLAGAALPIQSLLAGRSDIANAAVATGLSAVLEEQDVQFIGGPYTQGNPRRSREGGTDARYIGSPYGASEDIQGLEDLAGKTIGVLSAADSTDPLYVLAADLLNSVGLDEDDVDWAVIGAQPLRVQALIAGRVDFTFVSLDSLEVINSEDGFHVMIVPPPSSGWDGWQPGALWWTTGANASDPSKAEAIERFMLATMRATRDLVTDRDRFLEAAAEFQPAFAEQSEENIDLAWNVQRELFSPNGGFNLADIQSWLDAVYFVTTNPEAEGRIDLATIGNPRFVAYALEELGVDETIPTDVPDEGIVP